MSYFVIAALLGLVPAFIAKSKGRETLAWWFYGLFLFPIALVHSLVMKPQEANNKPIDPRIGNQHSEVSPPDTCRKCGHVQYSHLRLCKACRYDKKLDPENLYSDERECPHCAELIKKKAGLCKHCGSKVDPILETFPPPRNAWAKDEGKETA
jgi:hypothetical protein